MNDTAKLRADAQNGHTIFTEQVLQLCDELDEARALADQYHWLLHEEPDWTGMHFASKQEETDWVMKRQDADEAYSKRSWK